MSHLLSLFAMHRDGPGSLDVVFGADGDFEGAPMWSGPLFCMSAGRFVSGAASMHIRMGGRHQPSNLVCASFRGDDAGLLWSYPLNDLALDCRIPSVAARLIWLCGLALGYNGPLYCYESHDEDCNGVKHDDCCWYLLASRAHEGGAYYWQKNFSTEAAFIASMTLALAPKIAALGGPRG